MTAISYHITHLKLTRLYKVEGLGALHNVRIRGLYLHYSTVLDPMLVDKFLNEKYMNNIYLRLSLNYSLLSLFLYRKYFYKSIIH